MFNTTGIIAGTSTGAIKIYPNQITASPFDNIPTHNGVVSHIVVIILFLFSI